MANKSATFNTSDPAKWFRMYAEFATDPKVQMLSELDQRRYVMLLCLRCGNGDVTLHETEIAFQLRIGNDEWAQTKAILLSKELIDEYGRPTAWEKRQYASDSSSMRVQKHRDKLKQQGNVSVTPKKRRGNAPETETETEKKKKAVAVFVLPEWVPSENWAGYEEMRKTTRKPMTDRARRMAVKDLDKLRSQGYPPADVLDQSVKASWSGLYELKNKPTPKGTGRSLAERVAEDRRLAEDRKAMVV